MVSSLCMLVLVTCASSAAAEQAALFEAMPDAVYDQVRHAIESYGFGPYGDGERDKNLKALALLRRLPFPDFQKLERVRVTVGTGPGGRSFNLWRVPGRGEAHTLIMPDNSVRSVPDAMFSSIAPVEYEKELAELVTRIRSPGRPAFVDLETVLDFNGRGPVEGWYHSFMLLLHHAYAAACLARSETVEVFVHEALKSYSPTLEHAYNEGAWHSFLQGIVLLERGAPRSSALKAWRTALELYGESWYRKKLADYVETLERQVGEDRTLAESAVEAPESLPLDRRIAYWMARFPDIRARQSSFPGACWALDQGEGTRASDAIVAIGRPALPALIGHLRDSRLTRSTGMHRPWSPDRTVLRVQDVALQCITRIAGIFFHDTSLATPYLSDQQDPVRETLIGDVETWWRENADKPEVDWYRSRLDRGRLEERLRILEKIETMDPKAVDAIAVLKGWAIKEDAGAFPTIVDALVKRGDRSLVPGFLDSMRRYLRQPVERRRAKIVGGVEIWTVMRHGDAEDYRLLRKVALEDLERDEEGVFGMVKSGLESAGKPLAVPILVDFLAHSRRSGSPLRKDMPFEGSCMASLARLTGHDEGYVRTDREEKRAAAIERWLAWWEREGKADYAAAHPEVRAVLSVDEYEAVEEVDAEALPVLLDVADADPQAPVVFKVPREDIPGLLKGRRVIARRYGKDDLRWSFASADAAAAWFAGLRMRPARDGGAPSEALEELGPADDFTGVTVDHGGRPWRWQDRGGVPLEEVKRQVETAAETKRPFVSGAEVLLIDRRGRIWLRTYKIIFGYDPSERRWIERLGLTKEQRVGFEEVQDTGLFNITGPGYESASGVLFFGDRLGVHVYDGATWRHQSLYERNLREKRYYEGPSFFERPEFSEDDDGRVYVWSKWGSGGHTGTIGFWIYDRGHWENRDIIERLRTVVPLGRDEIWLCTDTSELALLKGDKLVTGEEAQKALHPNLRFKYAYGRAFDPRGTAFFRLEAVTTLEPIAKHRLRGLALPRRGSARDLGESSAAFFEGLEALPCKVDAQGWLWGVSRGGRLAGLSPDGAQTRSFSTSTTMSYALGLSATTLYAVGPDQCVYFRGGGTTYRYDSGAARAADATSCAAVPAMVVPIAGLAWPDSRGRMWCTFKTKEAPTAVFEADTWNVVDRAAEGIRRFELGGYFVAIPGTNGAMVFVDREHRWHFFDGDGRVHAASAEALILEHRDRLARGCKYPASRPGNEAGFHLVQDARGRFWWARWFHEWGVVDGARAIRGKDSDLGLGRDRGEPFEVFSVVGDGTKLLAIKRGGGGCLLDVRDGEIVRAGDVPIPVDPMGGRVSVFRDSSGRHWLRNDRRSAAVGPDGKPGDTHEGRLVLEDRTKGLWFSISHPGGQRAVKRVGANGAETVLLVPDLVDSPFLAEAPDGTVWALTRSGLVRVRDEGERLAIVEKHAVPVSMEDQLWCDGEGRVWLARPSREIIRYATAARATF